MGKIEDEPLSTCLKLLYFFDDLRHHCEEVSHNSKVCNIKDWSVGNPSDGN
jgi:hypothetical protein